jgi:hypothetical protein
MVMQKIAACLASAILLLVLRAPVADAQPTPQTQGGITFVSGGVAEDSEQAMNAIRSQYNLHLLFAQQGTGAYMANVPVQIIDAVGTVVLNAVSAGPFFYARLQPGKYRVVASHSGNAISRMADVPAAGGSVDLNYYWTSD